MAARGGIVYQGEIFAKVTSGDGIWVILVASGANGAVCIDVLRYILIY